MGALTICLLRFACCASLRPPAEACSPKFAAASRPKLARRSAPPLPAESHTLKHVCRNLSVNLFAGIPRRLQQLSERRLLRSSEYGGQCLQLFPECGSDAGRKPEFAVILKGKLCDAIVREDLMCLVQYTAGKTRAPWCAAGALRSRSCTSFPPIFPL